MKTANVATVSDLIREHGEYMVDMVGMGKTDIVEWEASAGGNKLPEPS